MTGRRGDVRIQDGATPTEFVFLMVFIALAVTVGAVALGDAVDGRFDVTSRAVEDAAATAAADDG